MLRLFPYLIVISQLLFLLLSNHVYAEEAGQALVYEISVLVDETSELALDDIIKMDDDFTPLEGFFSAGFTRSSHWFRIIVQRSADARKDWVLSAKPALLNDLRFYAKGDDGHYVMQQAGSFFTSVIRPMDKQYGMFSFKLILHDTLPQVFYLRLKTRNVSMMDPLIESPVTLAQKNNRQKLIIGLLMGGLLVLSINVILMWVQANDFFYIAFIGYVVGSVIHLALMEGMIVITSLPAINSILAPIGFGLFVISKTSFFICFYKTKQYFPRLNIIFYSIIVLILLAMLTIPFDIFVSVAPVILLMMIGASLMELYISWVSDLSQKPRNYFVFYGVLAYCMVFICTVLTALGVLGFSILELLIFRIGLFVVLVFIGLQRNFWMKLELQKKTQIRIGITENLIKIEKQRSKDKSTFLNLVAHEIKTPLAVIDSAAQILELQPDLDVVVRKRHHRIRSSISNLTHLLDNTFLSERTKNSPLEPKKELCELRSIVEQLIQAKFANEHFYLEIDDSLKCTADITLLNLALSNLLGNALKFSPNNSKIIVVAENTIKQNKDGLIISISNGYIAENRPYTSQWFTEHYQENTGSSQEGLGIGLYMVKKIAEVHGGSVECVIEPNERQWKVTIQLWLPELKEVFEK